MQGERFICGAVALGLSFTALGAAHQCKPLQAPPCPREHLHPVEVGSSSMTSSVVHAITLAELRTMVASYTSTSRST